MTISNCSIIYGKGADELLKTLNEKWSKGFIDAVGGILLKLRDREWQDYLYDVRTLYIVNLQDEDLDSKSLIQLLRYRRDAQRRTIISVSKHQIGEIINQEVGGGYSIISADKVTFNSPETKPKDDKEDISYSPDDIKIAVDKTLKDKYKSIIKLHFILSALSRPDIFTPQEAKFIAQRTIRHFPNELIEIIKKREPHKYKLLKSLVDDE